MEFKSVEFVELKRLGSNPNPMAHSKFIGVGKKATPLCSNGGFLGYGSEFF